jgi:hypothetical protein
MLFKVEVIFISLFYFKKIILNLKQQIDISYLGQKKPYLNFVPKTVLLMQHEVESSNYDTIPCN